MSHQVSVLWGDVGADQTELAELSIFTNHVVCQVAARYRANRDHGLRSPPFRRAEFMEIQMKAIILKSRNDE